MSDHPGEAERNLRRIHICDDVCLDLFHSLSPPKLGLELALVSHRFDQLVDMHFRRRKWALGKFEIHATSLAKMEKTLPFPQKELPNTIVGFARIKICSINSDIIAFLQRIDHLLQSDIFLTFEFSDGRELSWNRFVTAVWHLLNVSAITKMDFKNTSNLRYFRRVTSPSILRNCPNLRCVNFKFFGLLQLPSADNERSTDGQAVCKWLHSPRADGKPKVLKCGWSDTLSLWALKTLFLNAKTAVNFITVLDSLCGPTVQPFELTNSLTHERLTCQVASQSESYFSLLVKRSPIDKSTKEWDEWEREAMDRNENDWKVIEIDI